MASTIREPRAGSPYETILGESFALLHAHVQRAHLAPLAAEGVIDVEHGSRWPASLLIPLMSLPRAGSRQRVQLDVRVSGSAMRWMRRIGPTVLRTRQSALGSTLVERHGIGCIAFELEVQDGGLLYRQVWMRVAGVTVPLAMSPQVIARVSATETGWHVDVTVTWRMRLVCRYGGDVRPL